MMEPDKKKSSCNHMNTVLDALTLWTPSKSTESCTTQCCVMSTTINTKIVVGKLFSSTWALKCFYVSIYECVRFLYPVCAWTALTECCTGGIDDKPIAQLYINPLQLWGPLWGISVWWPSESSFLCFLPILIHKTLRLTDTSLFHSTHSFYSRSKPIRTTGMHQ